MAAALSAPRLIFDFGHSHYHSTVQNVSEQIAAVGRPVRIRMGKGPDATKGGGVVAIEDLKVTKVPWSRCRAPRSAGDLRQVRNSHKSVLAGECQRLIGALGLRDAENPMRSGVVYRDGTSIVDHQPPGLGKKCVSEIVLRTHRGRSPQSGRPPVVRSDRRTVADLVSLRTYPAG
jgi:hypothetical protein